MSRENMTEAEYRALADKLRPEGPGIQTVIMSDEQIAALTFEQAGQLAAEYGAGVLVLLPSWERAFFEWLRQNDPPVWNDLWEGDAQPYLVSLAHLPELLPTRRGFLINDLATLPNACFDKDNIIGDDAAGFLEAALDVLAAQGTLRVDQAFVVEVWRAPIDMWRFAYMYQQDLNTVKMMVGGFLQDGVLSFMPESTGDDADDDGGVQFMPETDSIN